MLSPALRSFFSSATWRSVPVPDRRLFIALIACHFLLTGWFISRTGVTADESDYYGYAINWGHGITKRVYPIEDSKSPIVAPALLPNIIKPWVDLRNDPYGFKMLQMGRWCMYLFQALGAFVLFLWMYCLWGSRQWLLPLVLYLFDPTVFSFGMIVGTDMVCASLVLATCYSLWRYTQTGAWRYWLFTSVFCALALVAKASMIYLPVLMLILLAVQRLWIRKTERPAISASQWMGNVAVLLLVCWLTISSAYQFNHMFFPVSELSARSDAMQHLKQSLSSIANWPVPLPYDYVSAFDLLRFHADLGGAPHPDNTYGGVSVLGLFSVRGPVWYYYLVSFAVKLPLLTLALLITALLMWGRSGQAISLLQRHLFVWLPALFFGLLLSLANPFQIGIRHALLVFPFLYMGAGYGLRFWQQRRPKVVSMALAVQFLFLLNYWPNMIAYTNELFWPKHLVYRYVNDSTIDYDQSVAYLEQFLATHPEYKLPPHQPAPGKFAINVRYLTASYNRFGYEWLYKNFEPVGHYMHNVLLFDISAASLREKGLDTAAVK
jgi:hypothetical protein